MRQAIRDYLRYLEQEVNAARRTRESYAADLEAYALYCEQRLGELVAPSGADTDLIRGWLSAQMDSGLKASSVARRLSAVKSFYRYLLKRGDIDRHPAHHLRPPRAERPLPVYVPTAEIERLLEEQEEESLPELLARTLIATLYECGLRRSELAGLKDADVDLRGQTLKVLGKGGKERIIPFGNNLAELLIQWRERRNETFGNTDTFFVSLRGKAMTGEAVYRIVHRALESVPNLSRRGAHALRHSFATDMLNSGADLLAIKELMGHSSVTTTVQYTHTTFKQLQQMYNAHPRAKKEK